MAKVKVSIGKHPDEMSFDECMAHVRRVLFWDPIDGQWTSIDFLNSAKWDRLAGYITSAHGRELESLRVENEKLRRLVTIRDHCIAGGCDLCQYRKNRESEDIECELDDLRRELGIWED